MVSILKLRSSGCVYCAAQVGLYCGLIVAVRFEVSVAAVVERCRKVSAAPRHVLSEPAVEHERLVVMVAPVWPPEIVLVDAFFEL